MAEWVSLDGSVVKNLPANVGDVGSIPGSESFPEGGNVFLPGESCGEEPGGL